MSVLHYWQCGETVHEQVHLLHSTSLKVGTFVSRGEITHTTFNTLRQNLTHLYSCSHAVSDKVSVHLILNKLFGKSQLSFAHTKQHEMIHIFFNF